MRNGPMVLEMYEPITSLWVGTLSPLERMCMKSFLKQGHPFHLYVYEKPEGVPEGVTVKDASEIAPKESIGRFQNLANFSDFFRYSLLYKHGGWWVDLDMYCIRPFIFGTPYVFSSQLVIERTNDEINSGAIRAPQHSAMMRYCLKRVEKINTLTNEWPAIGPALMMDSCRHFQLQRHIKPHPTFCPLHYFEAPENVLGPHSGATVFDKGRTHAVHLWNEELRRAGKDKSASYPGSLYERLQREAA